MTYLGMIQGTDGTNYKIGANLIGQCDTAAGQQVKQVIFFDFDFDTIIEGITIQVFMRYCNEYEGQTRLKVGNTPDYPIKIGSPHYSFNPYGKNYSFGSIPGTGEYASWQSGSLITFVFSQGAWYIASPNPRLGLGAYCEVSDYLDQSQPVTLDKNSTSLLTEKALYYSFPTINKKRQDQYATVGSFYAPETVGTRSLVFKGAASATGLPNGESLTSDSVVPKAVLSKESGSTITDEELNTLIGSNGRYAARADHTHLLQKDTITTALGYAPVSKDDPEIHIGNDTPGSNAKIGIGLI